MVSEASRPKSAEIAQPPATCRPGFPKTWDVALPAMDQPHSSMLSALVGQAATASSISARWSPEGVGFSSSSAPSSRTSKKSGATDSHIPNDEHLLSSSTILTRVSFPIGWVGQRSGVKRTVSTFFHGVNHLPVRFTPER